MKPRGAIIGISALFCVATIAGVAVQDRRLSDLRVEQDQLQLEIQKVKSTQGRSEMQPKETNSAGTPPNSSPSPELLRLRNQVSMLSRRQRELAAVPAENERLRARLAAGRTNTANALPPGYIRKSEAQNLGYTTPEATLQTMLWAVQNRDFTNIMASFTPEVAREMQKEMQRSGKSLDEFFSGADALPGFNVVERVSTGDDTMELKVEIMPGNSADGQPMRFRRVNGDWKLEGH